MFLLVIICMSVLTKSLHICIRNTVCNFNVQKMLIMGQGTNDYILVLFLVTVLGADQVTEKCRSQLV